MTRKIQQGNVTVSISKDAEGSFYALATRDGQCIPGVRGKHYDSLKAAERGAALMIRKAA